MNENKPASFLYDKESSITLKEAAKLINESMERTKEKTPIEHIQDAYNQAGGSNKGVAVEYTGIPFHNMGQNSMEVELAFDLLKPTMKKPFIGQTVHYYDHYHHQRAAIVTAIHRDNEEVDLCVLYPTRQDFLLHVKHDADHEKETWDFIN